MSVSLVLCLRYELLIVHLLKCSASNCSIRPTPATVLMASPFPTEAVAVKATPRHNWAAARSKKHWLGLKLKRGLIRLEFLLFCLVCY